MGIAIPGMRVLATVSLPPFFRLWGGKTQVACARLDAGLGRQGSPPSCSHLFNRSLPQGKTIQLRQLGLGVQQSQGGKARIKLREATAVGGALRRPGDGELP
eukprot:11151405-Alexandrium_andersonii.AAC.1